MRSAVVNDVAIADYLVARRGCPGRSGLAYDYLLARNGVFVAAENALLAARLPIAACLVRGLDPLDSLIEIKHGLLPQHLWHDIVEVAQYWAACGQEALLVVTWDGRRYRLVAPVQIVDPCQVCYRPLANALLEIHSHHRYAARFSSIDDADEQRLCLYGVIGRLDGDRPEVALRVGAYGYFMPVAWEDVFAGNRGTFRDVSFDPPDEVSAAHALPD
jgi:PRTRC genetic system protein A